MTDNSNHYDIIFAGWGASTCILMIEMEKNDLLKNQKILIIEPNEKIENDKTFCFWAEEKDEIYQSYQSIISNQWNGVQINANKSAPIKPVKYYHLDSINLYSWSGRIAEKYNISQLREKVMVIEGSHEITLTTEKSQFFSEWVFDSRPLDFNRFKNGKFNISQSFFGFKVKFLEKKINPDVYQMMDFRVSQSNATQFIYILPYSENSALVELTRFGKKLLTEKEAEIELDKYINEFFGSYEIMDREKGIIPMNSAVSNQNSPNKCVSIGTRAGNVKPSTGYAFKNMVNHSKQICKNGKLNTSKVKIRKRFHFYDQLLLIILTLWPKKGQPIFERLFKIKSASFVLKFLDEKTTIKEELSMFSKLQIGIFIKSVFYWFYWKVEKSIFPLLMIFYLLLDSSIPNDDLIYLSNSNLFIIIVGMLAIGIPHGALDHLTESLIKRQKITLKFIVIYIALMIPIFLFWYWNSALALIFFILYSAWHFGQTEVNYWEANNSILGFIWGLALFISIFSCHYEELSKILLLMSIELPFFTFSIFYLGIGVLIPFFIWAILNKKLDMILIILFFVFSSTKSLLLTFGLYFIFQHSRIGWSHLQNKLNYSNTKMFINALPFNIGAIILFILFYNFLQLNLELGIVYSFIFLSAISFPHVICMHLFYKKLKKPS